MTPGARLSAAIAVLDEIGRTHAPADGVLKAWGRAHRFAGSADRRAIAERVYQALRARVRIAWRMGGESGRDLVLGAVALVDGLAPAEIEALFSGEGHAPAPLSAGERARLDRDPGPAPGWVEAGVPEWIAAALEAQFGASWTDEAKGLVEARAPVDLRVNALKGGVDGALRLLAHEGLTPEPTPWSALGLRLPPDLAPDIQKVRAYASGWIEVQDEGSQIAAALAGAQAGCTVVDYCAGGGGKTLALAAALSNQGRLIACDVNKKRLDAIPERLARAGAMAELRRIGEDGEGTEDLTAACDLVLVDAPCSGSGTWRRHPESAWRLNPASVERLAALQGEIIARASRLVRPGGRLAYVTCSVLEAENGAVVRAFSQAHPHFQPLAVADAARSLHLTDAARAHLGALAGGGHTVQLTPHRTGTDGFFVALFARDSSERYS